MFRLRRPSTRPRRSGFFFTRRQICAAASRRRLIESPRQSITGWGSVRPAQPSPLNRRGPPAHDGKQMGPGTRIQDRSLMCRADERWEKKAQRDGDERQSAEVERRVSAVVMRRRFGGRDDGQDNRVAETGLKPD